MLRIYGTCRKMVVRVQKLVEQIKVHDAELADELKRSSQSVKNHVAEGCGVRGGHRRMHYDRARGSALEARGQIETVADHGYIELDAIADDQLDHNAAVMWKLTN